MIKGLRRRGTRVLLIATAMLAGAAGATPVSFALDAQPTALAVGSASGTYGGTTTLTATLTSNGTPVSSQTISFTINDTSVGTVTTNASGVATLAGLTLGGSAPGTYPGAAAASFAGSFEYAANSGSSTLTVNRAPLIVGADDKSRSYGGANPPFTAHYSGFVLGQNPSVLGGSLSFASTAVASSNAGAYAITPGGLTSTDYAITFADGILVVDRAPLTVTADDKSRTYGGANPPFTAHYSGFVLGQNPSVLGGSLSFASTAVASSNVGAYAITPGGLTSTNYAITFADGILVVDRAPLAVTADDKERLYGGANPVLTGSIEGIQNSDNITASYSTAATPASVVGTYAIVPTLIDPDSKLSNYDVTSNNGTLTIVVADSVAPVLAVPAPMTVNATGPAGAAVSYTVIATDDVTTNPTVSCAPASGSSFPIGTTTVACTATDAAGNTSQASFTVEVKGAGAQIIDLIDKTLAFMSLTPLEAALKAQLQAVVAAVATRRAVACALLGAYIVGVKAAPASAGLTAAEKAELITDATRIRAVVGCG